MENLIRDALKRSSEVLRGHRGHRRQSKAIRGHQKPYEAQSEVIRSPKRRTRRSARRDAPGMYSDVPAHQPRSGCALSAAISAGSLTNPSTSRRGGASQLLNGTSCAAAPPAAAAAPAACRRFVRLRPLPSKFGSNACRRFVRLRPLPSTLGSNPSPSTESSRNQAARGSKLGSSPSPSKLGSMNQAARGSVAGGLGRFEAAVARADGMAAARPAARCDRSRFWKV